MFMYSCKVNENAASEHLTKYSRVISVLILYVSLYSW